MDVWFVFLVSLCVGALLKALLDLSRTPKSGSKLPPGPPSVPFIGSLFWFRRSLWEFESALRSLHHKYGPVISLRLGFARTFVFISSHSLAYRTLIQQSAAFADRPPPPATSLVANSNRHNISSAGYGPNWRLFRRNLASRLFHPSRGLAAFAPLRRRVLRILLDGLAAQSKSAEFVAVLEHFRYAMFCLLVFMCFGGDDDAIDEGTVNKIMAVQIHMIRSLNRFRILNFLPGLTKIVLRNRWKELMGDVKGRENLFIPLIRRRSRAKQSGVDEEPRDLCYVDTLIDLELPEEGNRRLTEGEVVSLCSEFLTGGTDTTATALQWIMANLVKYPHVQQKLFAEIRDVIGEKQGSVVAVEEEDLQKMPYLKAVILEGLRRHPPGHFVLPHSVTEEVELEGYVIPKMSTVNFMVADMGWDPKVWEDPMVFRPERFMGGEEVDLTGSRGIKMMPFGAGRRICPGMGVAMLHMELFVANLVWRFEWEAAAVDLSEKAEFTVAMKEPLRAKLSPRVLPLLHSKKPLEMRVES